MRISAGAFCADCIDIFLPFRYNVDNQFKENRRGKLCGLLGFHFLAERIAFNKSKDYLREKGFENAIRQGSLQAAVEVYNVMPKKRTVDYFETLNPQVAESIRGLIAAKKASKN